MNEATIVAILDRIMVGMGYLTWPERRKYTSASLLGDLFAEGPNGKDRFLFEVKTVGETMDNRLYRKRFDEKRELISDFEKLTKCADVDWKIVLWVAFSPTSIGKCSPIESTLLTIADALRTVESEFPAAKLQGMSGFCSEDFAESDTWRKFGTVYCWQVS